MCTNAKCSQHAMFVCLVHYRYTHNQGEEGRKGERGIGIVGREGVGGRGENTLNVVVHDGESECYWHHHVVVFGGDM